MYEAEASNAAAIARVVETAWQNDFIDLITTEHMTLFRRDWFEKRTIADIENADTATWVMTLNDRIVAYVCTRQHGSSDTGELFGLYVHPQYQGQGLGKQLFLQATQWLGGQGKSAMIVWTFKGAKNNDFYHRLSPQEVRYRSIQIQAGHYEGIGFFYPLS